MAKRLNKKVLCFIDECGTAGDGQFYFGAVLLLSRSTGRVDKRFSDLLAPNANEIHAGELNDDYCQTLLVNFWKNTPPDDLVLINRKPTNDQDGSPPVVYARALIETVKIGLKRFREEVLKCRTIGNVEVITDVNGHNSHCTFDAEIVRAQREDGLFRGVRHVAKIDSAASRMLQLADVVAYSRRWLIKKELNASAIHHRFGIEIL